MWHKTPVPYDAPVDGAPGPCLAYIEHVRPVAVGDQAKALHFAFPRGDDENTQVDLWMPAACADEFVLGEGRSCPAAHQRNHQLPYLIARRGGLDAENTESFFATVVEAHRGTAAVTGVALLPDRAGLRIELQSGSHWTLRLADGGVVFEAKDSGGRTTRRIAAGQGPAVAVRSVDLGARRMTLATNPGGAADGLFLIQNGRGHNTFYRARPADEKGAALVVGDTATDLRIATGYFTEAVEGESALRYDESYVIQSPIRAQCRGAVGVNEAGKQLGVVSISKTAVLLDASLAECATFAADADGNGRSSFDIYDIGPGDSVRAFAVDVKVVVACLDQAAC
jgi:hypothetical protein